MILWVLVFFCGLVALGWLCRGAIYCMVQGARFGYTLSRDNPDAPSTDLLRAQSDPQWLEAWMWGSMDEGCRGKCHAEECHLPNGKALVHGCHARGCRR